MPFFANIAIILANIVLDQISDKLFVGIAVFKRQKQKIALIYIYSFFLLTLTLEDINNGKNC
ncbi:hypothetical protein A6B41_07565 [Mannheimia granulomatis]|nr:hypothetical protein A6B41_07565 [Mannheimia granulomatis]